MLVLGLLYKKTDFSPPPPHRGREGKQSGQRHLGEKYEKGNKKKGEILKNQERNRKIKGKIMLKGQNKRKTEKRGKECERDKFLNISTPQEGEKYNFWRGGGLKYDPDDKQTPE